MKTIYIIGSLRNPKIPEFANTLEKEGFEAFADWFSPGPDADSYLREYSKSRGRNYKQALQSYAARHIFQFDLHHIDRSDAAVMIMPAGKSGHLELGYIIGKGKPGYILFEEEPDRLDVMHQFATDIFFDVNELIQALRGELSDKSGTEQVGHTISAASQDCGFMVKRPLDANWCLDRQT